MRQPLVVVTATLAAAATSLTLAAMPVDAAPTATTAPPKPHAGTYVGRTSQGQRFTLRVGASRTRLTELMFRFQLHCTRHRAPLYSVSPVVFPWRLNAKKGLGFSRSFRDTSGEGYTVAGTFAGSGAVTGTLRSSWSSSHNGSCTTGSLSWHAQLDTH